MSKYKKAMAPPAAPVRSAGRETALPPVPGVAPTGQPRMGGNMMAPQGMRLPGRMPQPQGKSAHKSFISCDSTSLN